MKIFHPRAAPSLSLMFIILLIFAGCEGKKPPESGSSKLMSEVSQTSSADASSETESIEFESSDIDSSNPDSSRQNSTANVSSVPPREIVNINFPEGYTVYQMAAKLQSAGICDHDKFIEAINSHNYSYSIINSLPNYDKRWYKTEGYFYAASYQFYKDSTPLEIAEKMIQATISKVQGKYSYPGMSLDQIITLASIIEKEGKDSDSMRRISAVFHRRLNKGMKLESDVTIHYIENYVNRKLAPNGTDYSDYNTYKARALPVGPICSPSQKALNAAVNPDPEYSNMEYFFADSAGIFYFSQTYDEHKEKMLEAGVTEQQHQ